ncbi:MAG: YicC/YloC family endoribonuclease [Fidelibacterota bacterium]
MTGFGSGSLESIDHRLFIEVRAVNGRFFEAKIRLPRTAVSLEHLIRKKVKEICQRGHFSVLVEIERNVGENGSTLFDREKFENYRSILAAIKEEYGESLDIDQVITINDLLQHQKKFEVSTDDLMRILVDALEQLDKMRAAEGMILAEDMQARTQKLSSYLKEIEDYWGKRSSLIREEYESKIAQIAGEVNTESSRIIQEAAILAEKLDITEECVRCQSHLDQFASLLESEDPVGKRMNFLLQEINREINTVGAKSNQLEVIQRVVDMKDEVEKLKEQVQNVL